MKDFDEQREARRQADRTFRIGGETFVRKVGVKPEVLAGYETLESGTGANDTLQMIDRTVKEMIEDGGQAIVEGDEIKKVGEGGHARYDALRARDDDPLTLQDLQDLVEWLIEQETGRTPTQQPSRSPRGRAGTGTT